MRSELREIQRAVALMGKKQRESVSRQLKQMCDNALKRGGSMKDVLGLNEQMIEGIYGQAFRLYNTGKYKEASQLFRLLIVLNSSDPKYVMGLAACLHMMKEYMAAAELYTLCSFLDPRSPIPGYHASDCYIALGDRSSAIAVLEMAVARSNQRSEYSQLKDRALLTIASLQQELSAST